MRTKSKRAIAAATAATIALTSMSFSPAVAAPAAKRQTIAAAGNTDFSARRRHYHRGDRAVFGAVVGLFGAIASIAAANAARERYEHYYGYGPYYGSYPPPPYAYPYRYHYYYR
jgi:hypothetical protein